jgi:predicted nuclease of predicted toxin-antitoxin system
MKRKRPPYLKQKTKLYFDENFPQDVIGFLRTDKGWKRKCKIYSAFDFGYENRDDSFHFNFCKKKKYVLVTLDKDFMDDKKYPFLKNPGIIRVIAKKSDPATILANLGSLLTFLSFFPFPRHFMGDTKIEVGSKGCKIKGCDTITREIKTITVKIGDSVDKVRKSFGYP